MPAREVASATTAPPSGPPTGGLFGGGLLQAVLANNIPSTVDRPLVPTATLEAEILSVSSGSSVESIVEIPALQEQQVVATVSTPASAPAPVQDAGTAAGEKVPVTDDAPRLVGCRVTRANTATSDSLGGDTTGTAGRTTKAKRSRAAMQAQTEAPGDAGSTLLREQVETLAAQSIGLAENIRDVRQAVDDIAAGATSQIITLNESVSELLGVRGELKQLRMDVRDEMRDAIQYVLNELRSAPMPAIPQGAREDTPAPAKRQRTEEAGPAAAASLSPVSMGVPFAVSAPATVNTAVAPAVVNAVTQALTPMVPAPAPALDAVPAQLQVPFVVNPATMGPVSAPRATPFPATVTTIRGARRNYYFRMGPINTGGAAPLAVVSTLLTQLPNGSLFSKLVKEASLFPTDFTYVVATTYAYDHAIGIVNAWNSTKPDAYMQVSAEMLQGN